METAIETTVAFGCDHAGFDRKEAIVDFLNNQGYIVLDFGTFSTESVDYPDFAHQVANAVEKSIATWGGACLRQWHRSGYHGKQTSGDQSSTVLEKRIGCTRTSAQ